MITKRASEDIKNKVVRERREKLCNSRTTKFIIQLIFRECKLITERERERRGRFMIFSAVDLISF